MESQLIEQIKNSKYQHFNELGECLMKSENPGKDLLHEGYMRRCYATINSKLRDRNLADKENNLFQDIEEVLNNELDNLESHNNKLVFHDECRFIEDCQEKKVFNWFRNSIGKVICFPAFMSCYSEIKRLPQGSALIFEIKTSSASRAFNLNKVQPNHPEQEVLYKSKSCFKIIEVNENNHSVQLEEINSSPDLTIFNNEEYFALCRKKEDEQTHYYNDI
ncbi:ADP-ribosyltransferase [Marinifilum flexuosum]|uniref:ADP-ribosyltransferase n=1 Tax=Marinifilum flexuosum TaxID=1117708 RepID=UPI002494184B|nr:ADP-ribosyltransferase [Marinifilum flexuosum]